MEKTKIDWCDSTWNPVTGCLHGCEYCYARSIAHRFGFHAGEPDINERVLLECPVSAGKKVPYPFDFQPTFHKYRLNDYIGKQSRSIFVCSMADLFGSWVPESWIEEVFKACLESPQHIWIFLTKNPERYLSLLMDGKLPIGDNMWYGATAGSIAEYDKVIPIFGKMKDYYHRLHTFISAEPLMEDITKSEWYRCSLGNGYIDWLIIGAETGNRKAKIVPEKEWLHAIADSCKQYNISLFMKSSLDEIWDGGPIKQLGYVCTKEKYKER